MEYSLIMPKLPSLDYEKEYWSEGIGMIAGVDEAGMGSLAGPVTAAIVIFEAGFHFECELVRDSKLMAAKQRETAAEWIGRHALAWAVGEASAQEIDTLNVRRASHLAMRRAVDDLDIKPDMLLIDGQPAQPHATIPAVTIVNGDSLSFSIAAASVMAKVHRDGIMKQLDVGFPLYGFATHKGYGVKKHIDALRRYGACEHHRKTYAPVAAVLTK